MKRNATGNMTAAAIWRGLRDPVLALAEELALRRAGTAQVLVMLRVRGGGIDVERPGSGGREPELSAPGRPAEAVSAIIQRLGGKLGGPVGIAFSADQAVTRQLLLPAEPEAVLRAIARNKVEGLAPWPLAQCLWGMRVRPSAGDPRQVAVDVAVISRTAFEDMAAKLRQAGATAGGRCSRFSRRLLAAATSGVSAAPPAGVRSAAAAAAVSAARRDKAAYDV